MMMVRCYLGPSSSGGLGVFAVEEVAAGRLVWIFDPRFDLAYDREDLDRVPGHFREFLDRYTHAHPLDPDRIVMHCDEGRFVSHAEDPSVDISDPLRAVAARRIPAGSELTCDHRLFDPARNGARVALRSARGIERRV